jgi:hypothetical protein
MKKFERFIIYPMLFIALFFSFAGDGVQQTTAQQVYDEIIAKKITIVNDNGDETTRLTANKFGGQIILENPLDSRNQVRINHNGIGMSNSMSTLILNSGRLAVINKEKEKNEQIILLMGRKEGESFASFRNENGDELVEIGTNNNGNGLINIYDKYGENRRSYSYK